MNIRRNLFAKIALTPILLGYCFLRCDGELPEETLKWRSSVEFPANMPIKLGKNLTFIPDPLTANHFIVELKKDNIPLESGFLAMMRKFTEPKAGYHISVDNHTDVDFTVFGLLFKNGDNIANSDISEFYTLLTQSGDNNSANTYRVNLLGPGGLNVPPGMPIGRKADLSAPLCSLVLNSDNLMWRWIARIDSNKFNAELSDTSATTDNNVNIKLRIKFSGNNSFDSLLTL